MLFNDNMFGGTAVAESLSAVAESYVPTEESVSIEDSFDFASIIAESNQEVSEVVCALYVADVMTESSVMEGAMSVEDGESVMENAIGDMLKKIGNAIVKMWNKIKGWFANLYKNFKIITMNNKKFIKEYKTEIEKKAKDSKMTVKSYKYDIGAIDTGTAATFETNVNQKLVTLGGAISTPHDMDGWMDVLKKNTGFKVDPSAKKAENSFWDDCKEGKTWADVRKAIVKEFHGGSDDTAEYKISELNTSTMIKYLEQDDASKELDKQYKELKSRFEKSIDDMKRAEKLFGAKDDAKGNVASFISQTAQAIRTYVALLGNVSEVRIACVKEYTSASAKILKALVRYVDKSAKPAKEGATEDFEEVGGSPASSVLEAAMRLV